MAFIRFIATAVISSGSARPISTRVLPRLCPVCFTTCKAFSKIGALDAADTNQGFAQPFCFDVGAGKADGALSEVDTFGEAVPREMEDSGLGVGVETAEDLRETVLVQASVHRRPRSFLDARITLDALTSSIPWVG